MGGRAAAAAIYPQQLYEAVCRGFASHKRSEKENIITSLPMTQQRLSAFGRVCMEAANELRDRGGDDVEQTQLGESCGVGNQTPSYSGRSGGNRTPSCSSRSAENQTLSCGMGGLRKLAVRDILRIVEKACGAQHQEAMLSSGSKYLHYR